MRGGGGVPREIATWLRENRLEAGLTQEELAEDERLASATARCRRRAEPRRLRTT
jgi:transcriptional regulator with XRE-family HTH domain